MNQLTIIGFTGRDADLHYAQNGTPITTLSIEVGASRKTIPSRQNEKRT